MLAVKQHSRAAAALTTGCPTPPPSTPLRSMLASNMRKERPAGDADYCARMRGRSPKETRWEFDDSLGGPCIVALVHTP